MIDFLEDPDFRDCILHPETTSGESDLRDWEKIILRHKTARRAKYILISLKSYFERQQLSEADIQIRLEKEIEKYRKHGAHVHDRRSRIYWIGSAAAAILLLIGMIFLIQWINRPLEVYKTGFGERMTITLPDESTIELNSNSELSWDRNWETSSERVAKLRGEAFFKVKNRDNMPFKVKTGDITVHVIGTRFNVNSRGQSTQVFLEEGKVDVTLDKKNAKKYKMVPGEELVYQGQSEHVEKKTIAASEEISSWKEGLLIFRDEPLMKVLKSVSDIYGKEFVTKDSVLLHRNITTTIPLTNWEVSLTAIQLAMKLDVEQVNDTIRIKER